MDAAIYGIIGTLVGGGVAVIGAWLTGRQQREVRRMELVEETKRAREGSRRALLRRKQQCYADFLSAYWQEEGYLFELLELIRLHRGSWRDRVVETVDDPARVQALSRLNDSIGWITLLCDDSRAEDLVLKVNDEHDRIVALLISLKTEVADGGEPNTSALESALEELRACLREVSKTLRSDVVLSLDNENRG